MNRKNLTPEEEEKETKAIQAFDKDGKIKLHHFVFRELEKTMKEKVRHDGDIDDSKVKDEEEEEDEKEKDNVADRRSTRVSKRQLPYIQKGNMRVVENEGDSDLQYMPCCIVEESNLVSLDIPKYKYKQKNLFCL